MGSLSTRQAARLLHRNARSQDIVASLNDALKGKLNNAGTFTLAASATTTTVSDERAGSNSVIVWMPTTLTAATATANVRVTSKAKGSFVLTHANTADADKTFDYLVFG